MTTGNTTITNRSSCVGWPWKHASTASATAARAPAHVMTTAPQQRRAAITHNENCNSCTCTSCYCVLCAALILVDRCFCVLMF